MKEEKTNIELTPKALSYFARKHAYEQLENLGLLVGVDQDWLKGFEAESLSDIAAVCARTGFHPVVSIVPRDDAFEVFDGKAELKKACKEAEDVAAEPVKRPKEI